MAKYYKVNLYRIITDWTMEKSEELVGTEIVRKGLFFAKSLSGKRYKIVSQNYLQDESYDYDDEYSKENYIYYPDYEGQIRAPYEEECIFSQRVVVKKEEFTKDNEVSLQELIQYQQQLPTKQKIKSRFKR